MAGRRSGQWWWVAATGLAIVVAGWLFAGTALRFGTSEGPKALLDPAQVILLRTPGGFLEVGAMEKVEEFGWSARYNCPLVDCSRLLPPTISRIRVRAHYVWRVPLAQTWQLQREGDRYVLKVPAPQLQEPVGFHTQDMQIETTQKAWISPPSGPNREAVVRHLGPELARRGNTRAYVDAQRAQAEKTVQEFARKWMHEQGQPLRLPIEVRIAAPDAS